jgi:hypothetical protein
MRKQLQPLVTDKDLVMSGEEKAGLEKKGERA